MRRSCPVLSSTAPWPSPASYLRRRAVAQQGLADQMRRTSRGIAQANIDARLAEVRRQQLRVTIGEMQQMHITETRHVVDVRRVLRRCTAARERKARGGCSGEDLHEFAAIHPIAA